MRYRKKPLIIEAKQFLPNLCRDLFEFQTKVAVFQLAVMTNGQDRFLKISTLEGIHTASAGDWIICGVNGELYPCKPDIFEATYEEVH